MSEAGRRPGVSAQIHYGKAAVSAYRTHGTPLGGLTPIPESRFTGRDNTLLGAEIEIDERSDACLPAYTSGDNSMVVATDSMKNFIHAISLEFAGSTLEGWIESIGRRFLERYEQMAHVHVAAREIRFAAVQTRTGDGAPAPSDRVFTALRDDHATAAVVLARRNGAIDVTDLISGRADLRLLKLSGSAFAAFLRDEYTTLPERTDRALHVFMDVGWRYAQPEIAIQPDAARYVASEQVADLVGAVFHEFVSNSIQHLVHEAGQRMLERWPQLSEVSFEAQNRTWDLPRVSPTDDQVRVYTDPPAPYGRIGLVLRRE
jgi:urate oxidase / 2-oxo-4-hydroxy-4-carboxy-5-ureidoimidazoline decarboxylase